VAARLDISQHHYAQQEQDRNLPRPALDKIAAALGISLDLLDV
jgi:transcriptional regulator with XRE-family HTH domain